MGLSQIMGTAERGMAAAQLGLDVTGQNISNVNTEGYSRKVLTLTADSRYDEQFGQMGFGVEVNNIQRMRDQFIDNQMQTQLQTKGYYDQLNTSLERIENIFTEPQDMGLSNYMEDFWNAWQDLANNPADSASRSVVQSRAQVLVDVFHNVGGQLRDLRASQNDLIEEKVKQVNEILEKIYNLNQSIRAVEINNQNANDSRDQRDQLIKELSKYIDVSTTEDKFGAITVTSAGNMLVSAVNYSKIETYTSTFTNTDGTTRLDIGLRMGGSKKDYMPLDGEIKGNFTVRDELVPSYQDHLDELASGIVTKVNEIHSSGYDLNGFTGANFFDSLKVTANDIDLSAAIKQSILNIAAASGGTSDTDTSVINDAAAAIGNTYDLTDNDPPNDRRRNIVQGSLAVADLTAGNLLTEGAGGDYIVDYINGRVTLLSATAVTAAAAGGLQIDYSYQASGTKGPGDGSNALAIAQLRNYNTMSANYMDEATTTFGEFYNGMIGTLGIERNQASSNVDSRDMLIRYLEKQQDSVAGVSLDEEMANMVKFQHSFTAAARLINVVDDMMKTVTSLGTT